MSQYLIVKTYRLLTLLPTIDVDTVEVDYPGWIDATLGSYSGTIDGKLMKRYATPFQDPVPDQIKRWLVKLVDVEVKAKRGYSPSDQNPELCAKRAELTMTELNEAADPEKGLWDLPLRADMPTASGIKPSVLSRSDVTPYDWMRAQYIRSGRR